jgi:histidinol-phosphate aminotransferase
MAERVGERTKLVIVCNPNNPTGTSVGAEAFDRFAAALPPDVVLVIDEAYAEFARRPDFPDSRAWVTERPATIFLRTFSKLHGLAGLRVGYGVGGAELVGYLERARHPFNVSVPAEAAALAALEDDEHVARSRALVLEERPFLAEGVRALGATVVPSQGNFVFADFPGRSGKETFEALLREGVIVRPMAGYGFPSALRVTVGLRRENERLLAALGRILAA